jgi:hypothetical protein
MRPTSGPGRDSPFLLTHSGRRTHPPSANNRRVLPSGAERFALAPKLSSDVLRVSRMWVDARCTRQPRVSTAGAGSELCLNQVARSLSRALEGTVGFLPPRTRCAPKKPSSSVSDGFDLPKRKPRGTPFTEHGVPPGSRRPTRFRRLGRFEPDMAFVSTCPPGDYGSRTIETRVSEASWL